MRLRCVVSVFLAVFLCGTVAVGVPGGVAKHEQDVDEVLREGASDRRAQHVVRLGHRSNDETTSDIWGYSDVGGREYAIVGVHDGTSIVDVTTASTPVEVSFIEGVHSIWRDMKTLGQYLYIVSDSGEGGMQIVDLSGLPESASLVATYTGFENSHNIFIETERSLAFAVGTRIGNGGIRILDLSSPMSPVEVGSWDPHYVHDVYVVGTVAYAFGTSNGVGVIDVTDPGSPSTESTVTYDRMEYTHSGYVTADNETLLVCDEFDEFDALTGLGVAKTRVLFFDRVGDTFDYVEGPCYTGPNMSIDHNVFISDGFAYLSNYTYGLAVIDVRDMNAPTFFGKYDTYWGSNAPKFAGAWGVYPYLPSGNVLVSDINSGLYILGLDVDSDGLASSEESFYGTDPELADTDGDGQVDGDEVTHGYDPLIFDEGVTLPGTSKMGLVALLVVFLYLFLDWYWSHSQ